VKIEVDEDCLKYDPGLSQPDESRACARHGKLIFEQLSHNAWCGAGFTQIYGFVADGNPTPMMEMTALTVALGLVSAAVPSLLARSKR
jgi:hypothetical protein